MPTAQAIKEALTRVHDLKSLINDLLADPALLGWPLEERVEDPHEITYGWTPEELRAQGLEKHLLEGEVRQIRPFRSGQPWGIFLVEFAHERIYRTALRQVLRGLVPSRRRNPSLQAWSHEHLLFICTTKNYDRFTFAHFRGDKAHTAKLVTFSWQKGDRHLRTACEFNLPAVAWPKDDGADGAAWVNAWTTAFDKEPLTKDFFKRFDRAIAAVKDDLIKLQGFDSATAYSRAQLLLERLVFLYFLQNRGWLDQQHDYLVNKFQPHRDRSQDFSYYQDFLEGLFWTLASAPGQGGRLSGIPFLNGGLFDDDEFAPTPVRKKNSPPLKIRNATFAGVFDDFLEAFNFTVREDTPLDQDVAVDPEMLGKVFESIVLHAEAADPDAVAPDKRKATGSYYTPRIVVHFICREVLLQYLRRHPSGQNWDARLKALFELDATNGLNPDGLATLRKLLTPQEGAALRDRLRDLKCCDPAVGSGAFPVGLLHELLVLRRIVETAANGFVDPVRQPGTDWLHKVKEEIVQNCLFGVDIQQQAIEICRLRLWLTLVVDYDIGLDPFIAELGQFRAAIDRISQLPNLEMNFHRGDSLLDMISDVPVRIEPGALKAIARIKQVNEIQKVSEQLHHAKKAERKKDLRVEILRRRFDLTEGVLHDQLEKFQNQDSAQTSWLFGETAPGGERSRRLAEEMDKAKNAIAKVSSDRKELEKLAQRRLDKDFYPKLRRLEGADFDSPFNFAWQLDFAGIFRQEQGGFDVIVGNPPFVTARNPKKRELYRDRWKRVCSKTFLLVSPFFDLSFGLLRPDGQLGFIVSNAFMTRDIGKPLIEKFFPTVDLQKVVDCSGLSFPGHGTPTCLIFGRSQRPHPNSSIRVAGILPGGGDLRGEPEESPLWHTLAAHHDEPGYVDSRIAVADRLRSALATWPWNLDATAEPTLDLINASPQVLDDFAHSFGSMFDTHKDDVFLISANQARRYGIDGLDMAPVLVGDQIRNWQMAEPRYVLKPYDENWKLRKVTQSSLFRFMKLFRSELESRATFGKQTYAEAGEPWYRYHQMSVKKIIAPLSIVYPELATHGHFQPQTSGTLFTQTAPLVCLNSTKEQDYLLVAALLNSSTVLFRLKHGCFNKGPGEDEERDRFEYAAGRVRKLPVPAAIALAVGGKSTPSTVRLVKLAHECWERGTELMSLALRKGFEMPGEAYHARNVALPGYRARHPQLPGPFTIEKALRNALQRARDLREAHLAEMIARQEEMDWLVYATYGLTPDAGPPLDDSDLSLQREQRPFCLWAQAGEDFARAVQLIPSNWSARRRALWEDRLRLIRDNEHIHRIEQPVYKRRWDEQWKIGNSWQCGQPAYDAEFLEAFRWWLSEKAEWWMETQKGGGPVALPEWTAALWADPRVQAAWPVVAEATHRLDCWKQSQADGPDRTAAAPDATSGAFVRYFKGLVKDESVPDGLPFVVPWEEVEKKHKVSAAVKKIRGKLNVPRERFRVTANGLYLVAAL